MEKGKLSLYISMSLDGFIATKNDGLAWLDAMAMEGEDYGYMKFVEKISAYIIGRQTYDVVMKLTNGVFTQAEKYECYIITRQERPSENGVTFYNGDIEALVSNLKAKGKHIYCDGGGQIVKLLTDKNLIDEYIISIIPIILGDGKRLFIGGTSQILLEAESCKKYATGLMQLRYKVKK